jgi:hypothetical protein
MWGCQRVHIRVALVFVAVAVLPSAAQSGPSEFQQRIACMSDAVRLCAAEIPDRDRIRTCMATKHDQLSLGCRVVFDASVQSEKQSQAERR